MNFIQALQVFDIASDRFADMTADELKEIYRAQAKAKHPDKNGGISSEFINLKEAYLLLSVLVQENTGRQLVMLDKEEILNRYQKDTKKIYEGLIKQYQSINRIREDVNMTLSAFESRKSELEGEVSTEIEKLEKSYHRNWFKKILFFLPHMSEAEFWHNYHELVEKQSEALRNVETDLFKKTAMIYGEGINEILEILDTSL